MDLCIIIAYYDPGNHPDCLASFLKTLQIISEQKEEFNIEVIVADDGSLTNSMIPSLNCEKINQHDRIIFDINGNELNRFLNKKDIKSHEITHWLYLPKDKQCMSKARIWNAASKLAKSDNLFFLDDDNYFTSNKSIEKIIKLLRKYSVVFGQIQDSNGRYRRYESKRVQGTTFGIKRKLLDEIGGFGEWTEEISCGIDSDLWYKLFEHYQNDKFKACFTNSIQTIDSCSKRWKPFIGTYFSNRKSVKYFNIEHGCNNFKNPKYNPSRLKYLWIENLTE